MWDPFHPPPAPPAFGAGKVIPERTSSFLSQLIFQWLDPFLGVGFSRPLEEQDLWELPEHRLTSKMTDALQHNFRSRCPPDNQPTELEVSKPDADVEDRKEDPEKTDSSPAQSQGSARAAPKKPVYDSSLFLALHTTFFKRIWVAGILHLFSDTLRTTTPLLSKVLLTWLANSYVYYRLTDEQKAAGIIQEPRGIGYGIGLAFGLFIMQQAASLVRSFFCFKAV
ncbi:hypothetical protein H0H81_010632 [Sphagnurus paluster]|uniref:Uncharacterized protein n=1 Tax=Sphagnurus paluster TaxID=117069 RepID=A0A9P7FRD7_9AGAR|nr:hypothetical protein H0H81_010632 [Sphagnurus paluster]